MVKVFITTNCASCKKAIKWLKNYDFKFETHNIFSKELTTEDIHNILSKTENGATDIISTRSKVISNGQFDIESMTLSELSQFIIDNPSILRRPIIMDDKRLQIGYNEEEIRVFLPKEVRAQQMNDLKERIARINATQNNSEESYEDEVNDDLKEDDFLI